MPPQSLLHSRQIEKRGSWVISVGNVLLHRRGRKEMHLSLRKSPCLEVTKSKVVFNNREASTFHHSQLRVVVVKQIYGGALDHQSMGAFEQALRLDETSFIYVNQRREVDSSNVLICVGSQLVWVGVVVAVVHHL